MQTKVERRSGQPEQVEATPQGGQASLGDPRAAVRSEARLDKIELGMDIVGRPVGVVAEPLPDRRQPPPVRLGGVAPGSEVDGADGLVGVDEGARHAPGGGERADVAAEKLADEGRPALHRLAHRLGACIRVSVEIASDPRPEPQRRAGQTLAPDGEEVGGGVPEAVLEEPERLPDLVDDARPLRTNLVCLPQDRDLLGERDLAVEPLGGREAHVVELLEERGQAAVLLEDRARQRFRRMGGEDELDGYPARRRRDVVAGDTVPLEQRERLGERLPRRPALALVLAAAPDAVVLFGDVGEVEVDGERAQDDGLRLDVERRDRLGERTLRAGVAAPAEPCEQADALLEPVDVLSLLLGEDASEDLAEQADVRAERRVGRRVGGPAHGPTLPVDRSGRRTSYAAAWPKRFSARARAFAQPRPPGRAAAQR